MYLREQERMCAQTKIGEWVLMGKNETKNALGTYIDIKQAAGEINTGIATDRKYAEKAGAVVRIGRCYRINRKVFLDFVKTQN